MKKIILLAGLAIITNWATAQTEVVTGVMRGKDYGVTYALPKTLIEIEIKANKVTYTPGDFYKYAERYLRLENINSQPDTYWELVTVDLKPIGIPDSENIHFVKMKDKSVAPLIELTDDGIIKSINVPISERNKTTEEKKEVPPKREKTDPKSFLTQEILMAGSTAKMAELVAQEIYNIRESKNALTRGQADVMPTDGEQLKIMLDNLNKQEQALTTMFTGTINKEERTYLLRLSPEKITGDAVAFRFSKKLGVLGQSDLSGEPIYINIEDLKNIPEPIEEEGNKKKKEEGIAYNVPGKALVTLQQGSKKWFEGEISVTQFGIREYLAPTLFNRNSTIKVIFNPITGGIEKVDRTTE